MAPYTPVMKNCSICKEPYPETADDSGMCSFCEAEATAEVETPRRRGRPSKDSVPSEVLNRLDNDNFCSQAERLLKLANVKKMTLHYDKFSVTIESM